MEPPNIVDIFVCFFSEVFKAKIKAEQTERCKEMLHQNIEEPSLVVKTNIIGAIMRVIFTLKYETDLITPQVHA